VNCLLTSCCFNTDVVVLGESFLGHAFESVADEFLVDFGSFDDLFDEV
jgi:hypothetical protein